MSDATRAIDRAFFDDATPAAEDFFRHVNGTWLDTHPVPPEYSSWGAFHEVVERNQTLLHELLRRAAVNPEPLGTPSRMVGDYFAAAMDEATIAAVGTAPLGDLFGRIDAVGSINDVRDVAAALERVGASPLASIGISSDFEHSEAYLVYVGQGGLGLPERDYYTREDDRSLAMRDAYVRHVSNQLGNLDGGVSDLTLAAAERILAFETKLAEASYTAAQMRDVQLTLNRYDTAKLDELMPHFGLARYVAGLGGTQPTVNVDNAGFFSALDTTLAETPVETLRDYLRWVLVRTYASSLTPAFENEAFDFYGRQLGGQKEMKPRWKRALDAATGDIGEQVAQLYVAAAFSEHAKERCERMVEHLLSAMGAAIRGAEWMTEPTREQALVKLAGFGYKIGYPDEWRDYAGLEIGRDSHVANRMRCAAFEHARQYGRLEQPVDKGEWEMAPHSVNAYYHPLLNEIVFPAGILQPPFFYADADDAVNFGAIGAVIGHEITHGFDDQGSHFDATGALRDWWSEADRAEFMRRAQVLVEQFDGYEVEPGLHVNGQLTLGENIADLGGLKVALGALREAGGTGVGEIDGFTAEQRFFLSWATTWRTNYTEEYRRLLVNVDPHSPAKFRVNGPLVNLPEFASAFGIAEGSPMAKPAAERAHIW